MKQELENIKAYLLEKYTQYNQGFANVEKPNGTEIVLDDNNNYVGISDNKGNYFYIRSLKESSLEVMQRNCRPQFYKRTTKCRIVSILKNADEETHSLVLIEAVSRCGHDVTRSVTNKTQVFFEETGTRKINDSFKSLSLCLLDFDVVDRVDAKNCKLEICNC